MLGLVEMTLGVLIWSIGALDLLCTPPQLFSLPCLTPASPPKTGFLPCPLLQDFPSLKINALTEEKGVETMPSQRPGLDSSMALKTWFFLLARLLATNSMCILGLEVKAMAQPLPSTITGSGEPGLWAQLHGAWPAHLALLEEDGKLCVSQLRSQINPIL